MSILNPTAKPTIRAWIERHVDTVKCLSWWRLRTAEPSGLDYLPLTLSVGATKAEAEDAVRELNVGRNEGGLPMVRLCRVCDYCEEAPADGYVRAYQSHVCEPCYEDHHGPII